MLALNVLGQIVALSRRDEPLPGEVLGPDHREIFLEELEVEEPRTDPVRTRTPLFATRDAVDLQLDLGMVVTEEVRQHANDAPPIQLGRDVRVRSHVCTAGRDVLTRPSSFFAAPTRACV